jgi:hypothetical protein
VIVQPLIHADLADYQGIGPCLANSSLDPGTVKPAIFRLPRPAMNVGRTILALLIALSVAMLPAAGGPGAAAKSADMAGMAAMDDMDCCPHKTNPCDKALGDCSSMATCALKCFSFSATSPSFVVFPSFVSILNPLFGANALHSQKGSPPFRPPRV